MALPQCSDAAAHIWPTPHPAHGRVTQLTDCSPSEVLCTRAAGILNSTCDELSKATLLAARLDAPVLAEDSLARIRTNGLYRQPTDLAALLIHLASETRSRGAPLRFLSTNANNGWTAVLAAAYLHRTHEGGFTGSAFNDLKQEWACDGPTRSLLYSRAAGLSWRHSLALNPAAEAALMSYHPQARNPLWQTAFSSATELLPVAWVGSPPPFDVCWRMGQLGPTVQNATTRSGFGGLATDLALLASWCHLFVYHGPPEALESEEVTAALSKPAAHRLLHGAQRVGGFTVLRGHLGSGGGGASASAGGGVADGDAAAFAYVNKTPPAPPEYYSASCIEDAGGCNSHHHQERCGYPRGRDTLPLACLPSAPIPGCCEKHRVRV